MQNSQLLLNPLLHLAIIVPLLLIFMKERTRENYLRVLSIVVCYCLYSIALVLPYLFDSLHFINGSWNWNGKLFGLACGVILYFLFRRQFADNNFFTLKQNKEGLRSALKVAIGLLSVYVLAGLLGEKEFDTETLLFQISMPGIDEEVMCRGVMLGLMCSTLREGGKPSLNPAIIINGIWFGLVHSLSFQSGEVVFSVASFIVTGLVGYALAYIALRTRSILIPMLTHNICNFCNNLLSMIL